MLPAFYKRNMRRWEAFNSKECSYHLDRPIHVVSTAFIGVRYDLPATYEKSTPTIDRARISGKNDLIRSHRGHLQSLEESRENKYIVIHTNGLAGNSSTICAVYALSLRTTCSLDTCPLGKEQKIRTRFSSRGNTKWAKNVCTSGIHV